MSVKNKLFATLMILLYADLTALAIFSSPLKMPHATVFAWIDLQWKQNQLSDELQRAVYSTSEMKRHSLWYHVVHCSQKRAWTSSPTTIVHTGHATCSWSLETGWGGMGWLEELDRAPALTLSRACACLCKEVLDTAGWEEVERLRQARLGRPIWDMSGQGKLKIDSNGKKNNILIQY